MISDKYRGLMVGALFSLVSMLSALTIVVPVISVLIVGSTFESIASIFITGVPYSEIGIAVIELLALVCVLILGGSLYWVYMRVRSGAAITNAQIILIFLFEFAFVHTLWFYIHWRNASDFHMDGQIALEPIATFPFSSIAFVIIGALIDLVKYSSQIKTPNK
jgi:hypothetical protein